MISPKTNDTPARGRFRNPKKSFAKRALRCRRYRNSSRQYAISTNLRRALWKFSWPHCRRNSARTFSSAPMRASSPKIFLRSTVGTKMKTSRDVEVSLEFRDALRGLLVRRWRGELRSKIRFTSPRETLPFLANTERDPGPRSCLAFQLELEPCPTKSRACFDVPQA